MTKSARIAITVFVVGVVVGIVAPAVRASFTYFNHASLLGSVLFVTGIALTLILGGVSIKQLWK